MSFFSYSPNLLVCDHHHSIRIWTYGNRREDDGSRAHTTKTGLRQSRRKARAGNKDGIARAPNCAHRIVTSLRGIQMRESQVCKAFLSMAVLGAITFYCGHSSLILLVSDGDEHGIFICGANLRQTRDGTDYKTTKPYRGQQNWGCAWNGAASARERRHSD